MHMALPRVPGLQKLPPLHPAHLPLPNQLSKIGRLGAGEENRHLTQDQESCRVEPGSGSSPGNHKTGAAGLSRNLHLNENPGWQPQENENPVPRAVSLNNNHPQMAPERLGQLEKEAPPKPEESVLVFGLCLFLVILRPEPMS